MTMTTGESARKHSVSLRTVRMRSGSVTTRIRRTSSAPPMGARPAAHTNLASDSSSTGSPVNERWNRRLRIDSRTSMPASSAQLLNGSEVVVESEGPRPEDIKGRRRAHDVGRRDHHHLDPLPIADSFGGDRLGGLSLEDADQVGNDAADLAIDTRDQVLVLKVQVEWRAVTIRLDGRVAFRKTLGGAAEDVGDFALEDDTAVAIGRVLQHLDQGLEGVLVALPCFAQAATYPNSEADGAVDGGAFGGGAVHAVFRDVGRAAHPNRDASRQPLHRLVVMGGEDGRVAKFVGDRHRRSGHPVHMEGLHLELRESAS